MRKAGFDSFLPFWNLGTEGKVCVVAISKVENGGKKKKKKLSKNAERSCCVVADARPEGSCVSFVFSVFRADLVRNQASESRVLECRVFPVLFCFDVLLLQKKCRRGVQLMGACSGGGQSIKTDEQGSPSDGLMAVPSSGAPYQRYRRPAYSVPHAEPSLRASIGQSGGHPKSSEKRRGNAA